MEKNEKQTQKANANVVMLPRPIIRYDRDGNDFFKQIGTLICTCAEQDFVNYFNHEIHPREYIIREDGTIHTEMWPYEKFIEFVGYVGDVIERDNPILLNHAYRMGLSKNEECEFDRVIELYRNSIKEIEKMGGVIGPDLSSRDSELYIGHDLSVTLNFEKEEGDIWINSTWHDLPFHMTITSGKTLSVEEIAETLYRHMKKIRNDVLGCYGKCMRISVNGPWGRPANIFPMWFPKELIKCIINLNDGDIEFFSNQIRLKKNNESNK